jgi:predicted DNA-binding helix-hairpin-helix protein
MDCHYCPFRAGRSYRRVRFQPEELVRTFESLYQKGVVEGLFLSTGILNGGVRTQDRLLDAAEILRTRKRYGGYLHLKIMPGAEKAQVLRAMQLADRVSVNLEAPNEHRLAKLAPSKHFQQQLLQPLQWITEIRASRNPQEAWRGRWPSTTTQFVVGAAQETDVEILSTVRSLLAQPGFQRAYFEAFRPVAGTPLEAHPPEDPRRQQRLYQASFLLRDYGFDIEELPFTEGGHLPRDVDPKTAYAAACLGDQPIEINQADKAALLRVPGVGPRGAAAILRARKDRRFSDLSQLSKLGILSERAAPYITLAGKRPPLQRALI